MTHIFNAKAPSQSDADDKAYNEYQTKGDAFFRVGLSKSEFISQRNDMMKDYASHAKSQPNFYSRLGDFLL